MKSQAEGESLISSEQTVRGGLQQAQEDLQQLLDLLPVHIREAIRRENRNSELLEVVMDLGRLPTARFIDGEVALGNVEVSPDEIAHVVDHIGDFDDDNRAGIPRTLHRISAIRNRKGTIVGLTCRVGRAVFGTIDIMADIVAEGRSILLLGRPGVGKTTMLREMARVLAENLRVIVVDTSNEIGGDGDIPHPAVGRARRMQVQRPSRQHETMIEAVENHNPEVIIIDEIGREQEAAAARTINERGVQLIGTAHGNTLENLLLNPTLSDLVGGIESVTLSDEEARRRGTQKTVLERRAPPTFDMLVEIQDRQRLVIHRDVAQSVDSLLRRRALNVELRFRDETGEIHVEQDQAYGQSAQLQARNGDWRDRAAVDDSRAGRGERGSGGRNGNGWNSNDRERGDAAPAVTMVNEGRQRLSIFPYGVARNRLLQAARRLGVEVEIVDDISDADVLVTLKSYYRRRRRIISDAERRRKPVYVLRANTVMQMQAFMVEALNLEVTSLDPFEAAIAETEQAIALVQGGKPSVDLSAASSAIRRHQHQMARQVNLVSHSYGKEPNRHVRIFSTQRNLETGPQSAAR